MMCSKAKKKVKKTDLQLLGLLLFANFSVLQFLSPSSARKEHIDAVTVTTAVDSHSKHICA